MSRIFLSILLITGIVLISAAAFISCNGDKQDTVGEINGEPVPAGMYKMVRDAEIAAVYQYFYNEYGVSDGKTFWSDTHGDENPFDYLNKLAIKTCAEIFVVRQLAKEMKILKDTRYSTFLDEFNRENKRREEAVAKNEVIFGPVRYREYDYFRYVLSNTVIEIKRIMKNGVNLADDEELAAYVDEKLANRIYEQTNPDYEREKANFLDSYIDLKYSDKILSLVDKADVNFNEDKINGIPIRE